MNFKNLIVLFSILIVSITNAQSNYWTKVSQTLSKQELKDRSISESDYNVFELDENAFEKSLPTNTTPFVIYFPNSKGELTAFRVKKVANMAPKLAKKYASIQSFRGYSVEDGNLTIAFSKTKKGVSAFISSRGAQPSLSITKLSEATYISYSSKEVNSRIKDFNCTTALDALSTSQSTKGNAKKQGNAQGLRTLRLAVVAAGEYTELVGGTVEDALVAINNTINSANSVLELDLGVVVQLIAANEQLIYTDKATDPYDIETRGISAGDSYLGMKTQETIDAVIAAEDYDLGHLFIARAEAGGVAYGMGNATRIGGVGTVQKGSAWSYWSADPRNSSGFEKIFLHETGHQLGGTHVYSHELDNLSTQVEPSLGNTIMSYGPDNLYFNHYTIDQILKFFELNPFNVSLGTVNAYNSEIALTDLAANFYIPKATPFYLEVSATGTQDSYRYNWEELDHGLTGQGMSAWGPQLLSGPLFSSVAPATARGRYFPSLPAILDGQLTNNYNEYINYNTTAVTLGFFETLPTVPRTLSFGLTVRDINNEKGVYLDSTAVVVVKNTAPFKVTTVLASQSFVAGEVTTLTWSVGNTNIAPINTQKVNILLSTDGGNTFPITLAENVFNDGSEKIIFPNVTTTNARIKIAPVGNIYFTINDASFTITPADLVLFSDNVTIEALNCGDTPQSFETSFIYQTANGFAETSALSITGLPAGLTASLSESSVATSDTSITVSFQLEASLAAGLYPINIVATAPSKTVTTTIDVAVLKANTALTVLSAPSDEAGATALNTPLSWEANANAKSYKVQVSKENSFATTVIDEVAFDTSYTATNLDPNTTYYWRVASVNDCSESAFSSPFSFTTEQAYAQEFPLISHLKPIAIPDGASSYTITIKDNVSLLDLNVFTAFAGKNINGLGLTIESPDGTIINLTEALISDTNTEELFAEADSEAIESSLVSSDLITLFYQPKESLAALKGKSVLGDWVLTITNTNNISGIFLTDFTLKLKAAAAYTVPFAISSKEYVFGTASKPISIQATSQNGTPLSDVMVTIVQVPTHGTLYNTQTTTALAVNDAVNSNQIAYEGTAEEYRGEDYFYFTVNDQTNTSRPAIVTTINIGAYVAPTALPSWTSTTVNTPLELSLSVANFYLKSAATYTFSNPSNGSAALVNGKVTYTPNTGYVGLDTFTYTINDGQSEVTNTINVKVVNGYKSTITPSFMLEGVLTGHPVSQSIAISADGNIVAAASGHDPSLNPTTFEGHAVVYQRDASTGKYEPLGNILLGEEALDYFGGEISLSSDGKRLAVATNKVFGFSTKMVDYLKVYEYNANTNTWEQVGQTFTYEGGGSEVDLKLALNANGSVLAIANPRKFITDYGQGIVAVYRFNTNTNNWDLLGNTFEGTFRFGYLGSSISLNASGTILAVSEPLDQKSNIKTGYVKIFEFDGIAWHQKGKSLRGKVATDGFGGAIALNAEGTVIAVGADYLLQQSATQPGKSGYVSVYRFNTDINDWELKGPTIEGSALSSLPNLLFGHDVALNNAGTLLTVGAPTWEGSNTDAFAVAFSYNTQSATWEVINVSANNGKITSEAYRNSGSSVALSADGTVMWNGFVPTPGKEMSAVMAYKLVLDNETEVEDVNLAPKPNDGLYNEFTAQTAEEVVLSAQNENSSNFQYLISSGPTNGSLQTTAGVAIAPNELIAGYNGGALTYTSAPDATKDFFEYKIFDGEKYGIGFIWIEPIATSLSTEDFSFSPFSVYPNPIEDFLYIENKEFEKNSTLQLYNLIGQKVLETSLAESANRTMDIDVSNLKTGIYILQIKTPTSSYSKKIMKR